MQEKLKVLAAVPSKDLAGFVYELFPVEQYSVPVIVDSAAQVKARLQKEVLSLAVIFAGLKDEYGVNCAAEISRTFSVNVLLFVPAEKYDQACYICREASVFVLSWPDSRPVVWQAVQFLEKVRQQRVRLEGLLKRSRQKERDLQLVSRCKLMLMENYQWSEQKAHRYIEKMAMDHSITKAMVAKVLLDKMQGAAHA